MKHWNTLQVDIKREVRVGRLKSLVMDEIPFGRVSYQVPFIALNIVVYVNGFLVREANVQLKAVICPRAKLHLAALNVEREVSDVDATRGLEDGRRHPENIAIGLNYGHHVALLFQPLISATTHTSFTRLNIYPK